MSDPDVNAQPAISIQREKDGTSTRVDLMLNQKSISRLWIVPFTLHIGEALVRMDGIGGVGTDEAHRKQGYSRRVLEAAVEHMKQGDAALSMLYGIRDFYPKFGYATAGPEFVVMLTNLERDSALPAGWVARAFAEGDIDAVRALYAANTERATGAAMRPPDWRGWSRMRASVTDPKKDACRVAIGPDGNVHGYIWRARWCWYVNNSLEHAHKKALVLGEVMADSTAAADAVLAICRLWAREEAAARRIHKPKSVVLSFPPEGPVAAAAMRQDARFVSTYGACGDSMARVLNVTRLLKSLLPELSARHRAAHNDFAGSLTLRADLGTAVLNIKRGRVTLAEDSAGGNSDLAVSLPQTELARLALGAFPPEDILARLPQQPNVETARLLQDLFPLRYPHMHLPDRY